MRFLLLPLLSLYLASCIDDSNGTEAVPLEFSARSGLQSGIDPQQIRVLRSAADYAALLSETTLSGAPPTPDFSTRMLIAVLSTLDSCYGLSAESVVKSGGFIRVTVGVSGPAEVCPAVVGQNYLLIDVPRTAGQVSVWHQSP